MATLDKIGNHKTSIYTDDSGMICVIYWQTAVVKFNQDKIILNSGGYRSNTTKTRMNQTANQFKLDYMVYQKDWDWFVLAPNGFIYPFESGMVINRHSGVVENQFGELIERIK